MRADGIDPRFVTILVGDNPASEAYVARKHSDCREMGIASAEIRLPADVTASALERVVEDANSDPSIHGFLVQLPLPPPLDGNQFLSRISPDKDVDGLHPENLGRLLRGDPKILPCTPAAILTLLRHHHVPTAGKKVLIVGRGALVGRPLAMLMSMKGVDATVTLAHASTPQLGHLTAEADIVISAAGVPDLIRSGMVQAGAAVVGVGISYDSAGAMVSDIADDVANVARWVTPRHGSVGALTRAALFENLLTLASAGNVKRS